jgi:hypothetical protein
MLYLLAQHLVRERPRFTFGGLCNDGRLLNSRLASRSLFLSLSLSLSLSFFLSLSLSLSLSLFRGIMDRHLRAKPKSKTRQCDKTF